MDWIGFWIHYFAWIWIWTWTQFGSRIGLDFGPNFFDGFGFGLGFIFLARSKSESVNPNPHSSTLEARKTNAKFQNAETDRQTHRK